MDEPRVYHTEWNKSEREKQVSNINAYMWNLEKWHRCMYFQGRNRNADGLLTFKVRHYEPTSEFEWQVTYLLIAMKMKGTGG